MPMKLHTVFQETRILLRTGDGLVFAVISCVISGKCSIEHQRPGSKQAENETPATPAELRPLPVVLKPRRGDVAAPDRWKKKRKNTSTHHYKKNFKTCVEYSVFRCCHGCLFKFPFSSETICPPLCVFFQIFWTIKAHRQLLNKQSVGFFHVFLTHL